MSLTASSSFVNALARHEASAGCVLSTVMGSRISEGKGLRVMFHEVRGSTATTFQKWVPTASREAATRTSARAWNRDLPP